MVARPEHAWSLIEYRNGEVAAFGLGSYVVVLFVVGIACYVAGAFVFSRREIPAPL
jgi:ABC-type transport system involved in multi-copper enzyme maturation permease subunit